MKFSSTIRKNLIAFCLAGSAFVSPAFAGGIDSEDKGVYLSIGGGINGISDIEDKTSGCSSCQDFEFDRGFAGAVGLGYDFGNNWRTELNFKKSKGEETKKYDNVDVDITTVTVNAFYDFKSDSRKITPYIGAGIGTGNIDAEDEWTNSDDENMSVVTLKVGASYPTSENVDMFGEVYFERYGDFDLGSYEFENVNSLGVIVGGRISL